MAHIWSPGVQQPHRLVASMSPRCGRLAVLSPGMQQSHRYVPSCRGVVLRSHLASSSSMCRDCATAHDQTEGSGSRQQTAFVRFSCAASCVTPCLRFSGAASSVTPCLGFSCAACSVTPCLRFSYAACSVTLCLRSMIRIIIKFWVYADVIDI